jgi:uncharacterized damage-inducible protein DinB
MDVRSLLLELFDRIPQHIEDAVIGLHPDLLSTPPAPGANTVGWLVWHLTRVQDHHVSELLGEPQVWETGDWPKRFGVPPDPHNTGFGHSPEEVASIQPESPDALIEYYDAVASRTRGLLEGLSEADLDRVVDERWDPPVTLGVRLVSIADDDIQHAGQATYVRGLLERHPQTGSAA